MKESGRSPSELPPLRAERVAELGLPPNELASCLIEALQDGHTLPKGLRGLLLRLLSEGGESKPSENQPQETETEASHDNFSGEEVREKIDRIWKNLGGDEKSREFKMEVDRLTAEAAEKMLDFALFGKAPGGSDDYSPLRVQRMPGGELKSVSEELLHGLSSELREVVELNILYSDVSVVNIFGYPGNPDRVIVLGTLANRGRDSSGRDIIGGMFSCVTAKNSPIVTLLESSDNKRDIFAKVLIHSAALLNQRAVPLLKLMSVRKNLHVADFRSRSVFVHASGIEANKVSRYSNDTEFRDGIRGKSGGSARDLDMMRYGEHSTAGPLAHIISEEDGRSISQYLHSQS